MSDDYEKSLANAKKNGTNRQIGEEGCKYMSITNLLIWYQIHIFLVFDRLWNADYSCKIGEWRSSHQLDVVTPQERRWKTSVKRWLGVFEIPFDWPVMRLMTILKGINDGRMKASQNVFIGAVSVAWLFESSLAGSMMHLKSCEKPTDCFHQ